MSEGAAILIHSHTHIVHEEEEVVCMFGMRLQQVSCHTEEQIGEGRHQEDAQRQGGCVQGVPQGPYVGPPVQQQHGDCQQVSPHIQGFIVSLEEAEEVAAPVLMDGTVA